MRTLWVRLTSLNLLRPVSRVFRMTALHWSSTKFYRLSKNKKMIVWLNKASPSKRSLTRSMRKKIKSSKNLLKAFTISKSKTSSLDFSTEKGSKWLRTCKTNMKILFRVKTKKSMNSILLSSTWKAKSNIYKKNLDNSEASSEKKFPKLSLKFSINRHKIISVLIKLAW